MMRTVLFAILILFTPLAQAQKVILEFGAKWCGPCQSMKPAIAALQHEGRDVRTFDVDVPQDKQVADKYHVQKFPTFIAVDANGYEVSRQVGACPIEKLRAMFGQAARKTAGAPRCNMPALVIAGFMYGHEFDFGTGAVVDTVAGKSVVLTCAHTYHANAKVVCETQGGKQYIGHVIGIDRANDICVMAFADMGIKPMIMADHAPKTGDELWTAGFAGGKTFLCTKGKLRAFVKPESNMPQSSGDRFMDLTCPTKQGCSGGPLLNDRGEIVGTITASNFRNSTIGPCLPYVMPLLKCQQLDGAGFRP